MVAKFADLSNEYILIVDDEPDNLEVAQQTLELLHNARVKACTSGQAALDCLTDEMTIILSDLMMPGMSGFELLPKLRERTSIPVIALTAAAMLHDKEKTLAAGFDGYITKPFEAADISACIADLRAHQRQFLSNPTGIVVTVAAVSEQGIRAPHLTPGAAQINKPARKGIDAERYYYEPHTD